MIATDFDSLKNNTKTISQVTNLVTFKRIKLKKERLDLATIVSESIASYKENANHKNITIKNKITAENYIESANFTISIVLNNISSNAIKYTPHLGVITIASQVKEKEVVVSIKDSGVGMDKETINSLLQTDDDDHT